jgi:outer membrane protein assembly factor BamB
MPDRLEYDENSLALVAGRVVTITLDRSLQAYDAQNGQLAWSRLLSGYDRQVRLMNNRIVVMDYLGDDYTYSLVFLDPVDGREESVMTPTCQVREYSSETLDTYSGILYEPTQGSLYLFYDSFDGCIQRIELPTGQVTWQTPVEDGFSFTPYGFNGLMTDSTIYFQNEEQLLAVDKASGMVRTLLENEDYEFVPLAVSGDTLIARARRTRGTERFELWGVDAGSGNKKWSLELENTKPLDPPNELVGLVEEDESGWGWRLAPTGLLLLDFQAGPTQLVLTTISLADGSTTSEVTVPLEDDGSGFYSAPTVIGWWNQVVYFVLDTRVYAVDTNSGEVLVVYQ